MKNGAFLSRMIVAAGVGWMASNSAAAAGTEETIDLRPKLAPGSVRYVELTQEIEQVSKGGRFGEEGQTVKSSRTRGVLEKATQKSGGFELDLTFDRLRMETEARRGRMTFDSDVDDPQDKENRLAPLLGPMLGTSFQLELDDKGQVRAARGMSKIFDKVEETAAGHPVLMQLYDEFTDEGARLTWGDARFLLYPPGPVKAGDTWTRTVRTPAIYLGNLEREYRCTLESIGSEGGRKTATVQYTADIRPAADLGHRSRMFLSLLTLKSGRVEGTAVFDVRDGQLIRQSDAVTLSIEGEETARGTEEKTVTRTESTTKQTLTVISESQRQEQKAENKRKK
jgi:hypothetical protein